MNPNTAHRMKPLPTGLNFPPEEEPVVRSAHLQHQIEEISTLNGKPKQPVSENRHLKAMLAKAATETR
jgi:hypothetical protein